MEVEEVEGNTSGGTAMENEKDAFSMLGHSLPNGSPQKSPSELGAAGEGKNSSNGWRQTSWLIFTITTKGQRYSFSIHGLQSIASLTHITVKFK